MPNVHRSDCRRVVIAAFLLLGVTTGCFKSSTQPPDKQAQQAQPGQQPATPSSSAAPASAPASAAASTHAMTLPTGTSLQVTLDQSLASDKSHSGDGFQGSLARAVELDGMVVFPKNARVLGKVTQARASGRLQTPALLSITLSSIEVNGTSYDISTSSITRQGQSHKKRNTVAIGGGAAAGAVIGAIAGGGKGAAIGAGAGAAAGTGGAALTGKQDITLAAETILTFRLKQPVSINVKN